MDFHTLLKTAVGEGIGLCVGLDPVMERLPSKIQTADEPLFAFNLEIIEATSDFAAAYKPNLAFYEAHGAEGWRQLEKTIKAIPSDKVIIGDAKRGDIGSTAKAYATALFDRLGVDAATVNPYLGSDALEPFIERDDKGIFVLAVTTNPGGSDIQELLVDGEPLYRYVIRLARRLNKRRNIGLVIGATKPDLWQDLLQEAIDLPLLVPGIGAQGGDTDRVRRHLENYPAPVLVNASRSILYASSGDNFKSAARDAAEKLCDQLRR